MVDSILFIVCNSYILISSMLLKKKNVFYLMEVEIFPQKKEFLT